MVLVAPILNIVECIICLETLKKPFKVCKTGHLMCSSCMVTLSECPLCKEKNFWEDLTAIKKLLDCIPHPCRHRANGCKAIVEPNSNHEVWCECRLVSCKETVYACCKDKVPLCKLLQHYQTKHKSRSIICSPNASIQWRNYRYKDKSIELIPMNLFGHFFWLKRSCVDGIFKMSFHMHPITELKDDFFITFKLNKGDVWQSFNMKVNVDSALDLTGGSMCVPQKTITWFISEEKHLTIHYEVHKKTKTS